MRSKSVCLCYCKWAVGLDLITARMKHVCLSNFCEPSSPETGDFEFGAPRATDCLLQSLDSDLAPACPPQFKFGQRRKMVE